MSIRDKAYIVGIYEHPTRMAADKSLFQLHAEVAQGALEDARLRKTDIDGYFCASGDTPGLGPLSMVDYLGLKLRHMDSTDVGGSSYLLQVVNSPMIADPLHRLDCCVISDGGGAIILAKPEIAKSLKRPLVKIRGAGEAPKHQMGGKVDLTYSGAVWSGPAAFAEAGVKPADIKYASIYDSFTITVVMQLEDLGFCEKGQGGSFVSDGNLIAGVGKLPFNTDGGGLCNNHPSNRGGLTKVLEAVRQLRGEAHPAVQVNNCDIALAHGTGGSLGTQHAAATVIMERE